MQRNQPLKRTTRLRPRSKKTATFYRTTRAPLVAKLLTEQPTCQRCHLRAATDVHEIQTRARGGGLTDPNNLALLCRSCHTWITTNPNDATRDGWLRPSWNTTKHPEG